MLETIADPRIRKILSPTAAQKDWEDDLDRLRRGDETLTRKSANESAIRAVQRLMVFLGYSTASSGAFLIDGDFGRGTNRGVAQFQFEHGLTRKVTRSQLCYQCSFRDARKKIVAIPDVRLDLRTVNAMLEAATAGIEKKEVTFARFEDALFHLNSLQLNRFLTCAEILKRYGAAADRAVASDRSIRIQPEWVLAIIRQETAGVVRPRFEQHKLSKFGREMPGEDLAELRLRSMSIGLGQVMGFNFKLVGATSARAMLSSPLDEQVLYVARFLAGMARRRVGSPKRLVGDALKKQNPTMADFRAVAHVYNGSAYETHFYHEKLKKWFGELQRLRPGG